MTDSHATTVRVLVRRSEVAALTGILLLYVADWLLMVQSVVQTGEIDFGFTQDNVIYILVRDGLVTTAVLVAGAVGLGRRSLLVAASIVAGAHTVFTLGVGGIQLVLSAREEILVETVVLTLCLLALCLALVLGFFAASRGKSAVRWVGVLLAVAGAAVWSIARLIRPFGGPDSGFADVTLIALIALLVVLAVIAAGLLGMRSTRLRYVAFALCVLLALWQAWPLSEALAFLEPDGVLLLLRTLLIIAAAVFAFLAARSWQRSRVAVTTATS